jgi:hypothetical protein
LYHFYTYGKAVKLHHRPYTLLESKGGDLVQDAYPPLNSFQALFYLEAAVTAIGTLYLAISQRQAKNYDKYEDEEEQERREAAQKELSRLVDAAKAENQLEFVKGLQAQAKSMQSLAEHLGDELVYVKRRQRQGMAIQCGSVALMLALLVGFFFYQMQTADAIHTVASLQAPAAATTVASVAPAKPVLPVSEIHSKPHMKAVVKNTTHKKPKLKPHSVPYEPPMDVAAPASDTVANTNNPT